MRYARRQVLTGLATTPLTVVAMLHSPSSQAQSFPERPIRLIVPYAVGGSTDVLARGLAEQLRRDLGQAVLVENKPGANTAVGAQITATAAPDGYTLLICTGSTVVTNPMLYPKLAYDPGRDLAPISLIAGTPLVVAVNPKLAVYSLADLIGLAKAQPGRLNYASTGAGSMVHLATLFLEASAGIDMTHIPYNGSSQAIIATIAGDVQIIVDSIGSSLPQIKAGKLRAIAVTTRERLKVLPEVPTVAESGFPSFDVSAWYGIMAPAKTPPEIITRIHSTISKVLVDKAFREQFEALGLMVPVPIGIQAYREYIRAESEKWGPIIKAKKIGLE